MRYEVCILMMVSMADTATGIHPNDVNALLLVGDLLVTRSTIGYRTNEAEQFCVDMDQ